MANKAIKKEDILIFISALLYALPFRYSCIPWWTVIFFPIPFLYVASIDSLTSKNGFAWAFISGLLHAQGGIIVVMKLSGDWWYIGCLLGICMVVYQALVMGICIILTHSIRICIVSHFANFSHSRLISAAIALLLFITWLDRYSLIPFDVVEGYGLMHPLILFVNYPPLLYFLPIIGKFLLTCVFLLLSVCAVMIYNDYNRRNFTLFCVIVLPWVLSLFLFSYVDTHRYRLPIVAMHDMFVDRSVSSQSFLSMVAKRVCTIISKDPTISMIIMPESAIQSPLFDTPMERIDVLNELSIGRPVHILCGVSHDTYNTVYWLYNGIVQAHSDKRHAMMMTERIPRILQYFNDIYCSRGTGIIRSDNERVRMNIENMGFCTPYLCSELFFNEYPDDPFVEDTIIALVNDSVFLESIHSYYVIDLLLLLARFKAVYWRRPIVYVSYNYFYYIDRWGRIITKE
jgi:apolipoprotein N-acyltransferase